MYIFFRWAKEKINQYFKMNRFTEYIGKDSDRRRGRPETSLFINYYT